MRKKLAAISIILVALILSSCNPIIKNNADIVRTADNALDITIEIPSTEADRIVVSSAMLNSMDIPVYSAKKEYKDYNGGDLTYNVGYYGKHEVVIELYKGKSLMDTIIRDYIVTSDNYNIALLSATLPVTYTSLMLADEGNTTNPINATYPTIVTLERSDAFNWNALLPNMTDCPFIDGYKTGNNGMHWSSFIEAYKAYVSYLRGLNPSSKFHFIFNDFDSALIPLIAFEAGLSTNDFTTVLISDGTGTYSTFTSCFGKGGQNDKSISKYNELASIWTNVKTKALSQDSSYINDLKDYAGLFPWLSRYMVDFVPVLINDPDLEIKWIVNRKNADVFGSSEVYTTKVQNNSNIAAINMNNDLLLNLNEEEKQHFANLYSLPLDAFDEADKEGKKIMIFLGTRDDQKLHLDEFFSFFANYYGTEDYAFFYKGHPGELTSNNSARAEIIEKYGWQELDAQIPAELFYFFRPDCIMGGYPSSTYNNIEVDISFITIDGLRSGLNNEHDYINRADGYVETDTKGYHVVLKDGSECYWAPNNPSDFNF